MAVDIEYLERNDLKAQIHEMETFLNDYGLIWVGNASEQEFDRTAAVPVLNAPSEEEVVPLRSNDVAVAHNDDDDDAEVAVTDPTGTQQQYA